MSVRQAEQHYPILYTRYREEIYFADNIYGKEADISVSGLYRMAQTVHQFFIRTYNTLCFYLVVRQTREYTEERESIKNFKQALVIYKSAIQKKEEINTAQSTLATAWKQRCINLLKTDNSSLEGLLTLDAIRNAALIETHGILVAEQSDFFSAAAVKAELREEIVVKTVNLLADNSDIEINALSYSLDLKAFSSLVSQFVRRCMSVDPHDREDVRNGLAIDIRKEISARFKTRLVAIKEKLEICAPSSPTIPSLAYFIDPESDNESFLKCVFDTITQSSLRQSAEEILEKLAEETGTTLLQDGVSVESFRKAFVEKIMAFVQQHQANALGNEIEKRNQVALLLRKKISAKYQTELKALAVKKNDESLSLLMTNPQRTVSLSDEIVLLNFFLEEGEDNLFLQMIFNEDEPTDSKASMPLNFDMPEMPQLMQYALSMYPKTKKAIEHLQRHMASREILSPETMNGYMKDIAEESGLPPLQPGQPLEDYMFNTFGLNLEAPPECSIQ